MTHFLNLSRILITVAVRNLFLHKIKTLFMGGILSFGCFLFVFGLSLLSNIEQTVKDGIIHSVAGHLQVYSSKAKDSLALFGSNFMGKEDLGQIDDYAQLRHTILQNPNVKEIVPMGFETSLLGRGNDADDQFDSLREALKTKDDHNIQEKIEGVKFYISNLKKEVLEQEKIVNDETYIRKSLDYIAQTEQASFWTKLLQEKHQEELLQFLESKIAPISGEKPFIYLRYLGTNPDLFRTVFDKFKIVRGEMIPQGRRGILLSYKISEDFLKMNCARKFDAIHKKVVKNGIKIADDAELKRFAQELSLQYRPIVLRLDKEANQDIHNRLAIYLKTSHEENLVDLLKQFLIVNDENFVERYNWFYQNIAPRLRLYEINPGETIILKSYTKSGYTKSVSVKIYGVYTFEGLDDSDIAGSFNMVDMVTFRELFGQLTEENKRETAEIQKEINTKDVKRDEAEAVFFGEDASVEETKKADESLSELHSKTLNIKQGISDSYDVEILDKGLLINAAIVLKNEALLKQTQKELQQSLSSSELKIVDWRTASGTVGQFVEIIRYVLIFGVAMILLIALVIINNSFMVATFERSMEIGTMRAFGAQKRFITGLFVTEAIALSFISSVIGSLGAYILLAYLHKTGIPSTHDVITFLFAGPRLYPHIFGRFFIIGPAVVTILAAISSLYPALFASRIPPAQAMQEKE